MTTHLPRNAAGVSRWVCDKHDKQLGLEISDVADVVSIDAARKARQR